MNTQTIEININIKRIEDLRIKLNGRAYTLTPVNEVSNEKQADDPTLLNEYAQRLIAQLKQENRQRTSETYHYALKSFRGFLPEGDIAISDIDAPLICRYEKYLKDKGLVSNTTSFYMRVLRTIYNKAVACGITPDKKPFTEVYTGIGKTVKRAIPLDAIQRISGLRGLSAQEIWTRDMFLFSFYTRGMSFVDMAYLTPQNIKNGVLTYRRRKTKQEITMRWEPQMQEIVDRYPPTNSRYLLPIIRRNKNNDRRQYTEAQRVVNAVLKQIGKKAEIEEPLTMYVARHSWASIAQAMNVPINVISQGMGHTTEKTTLIYLKSLLNKGLDKANANIIDAVIHPQEDD